jgi:hypothetical protein
VTDRPDNRAAFEFNRELCLQEIDEAIRQMPNVWRGHRVIQKAIDGRSPRVIEYLLKGLRQLVEASVYEEPKP